MNAFILLAVLAVTPEHRFSDSIDFLKKHGTTIDKVCKKYHAKDCFIRREPNVQIDELGLAAESGTYSWKLYGKKK